MRNPSVSFFPFLFSFSCVLIHEKGKRFAMLLMLPALSAE